MDPIEKRELKRRALAKLAAQKRRAGLLRGRVVIASLICFLFLWGAVFAQMVTGNDPVLSAKQKAVATRTVKGPRKAKKARKAREAQAEVEAVEPEAETETEILGPELEAAESEFVEAEPEFVEEEPEFVEEEVEPLVTSQS